MYAVVGQVKVDTAREGEARKLLEEFTVPAAKGLEGFNNGIWARALDGDAGHSLLLFDSEANARAAAERIAQGPPPDGPVTFTNVTVCEVVAQT
jgi:hypothetical protein